jgi:hypothetical protein
MVFEIFGPRHHLVPAFRRTGSTAILDLMQLLRLLCLIPALRNLGRRVRRGEVRSHSTPLGVEFEFRFGFAGHRYTSCVGNDHDKFIAVTPFHMIAYIFMTNTRQKLYF